MKEVYNMDIYEHDDSFICKPDEHFCYTSQGLIRLHYFTFTCECETVSECREKRDRWLKGEAYGCK